MTSTLLAAEALPPRRAERRRWFRRLLGVALALVTVEAVVRQTEFDRFIWDPEVGQLHRPGVEARFSREGFGRSHWLAKGLRRDPRPVADARKRVLVIGDSFTESLQVGDGQVFTALTNDRLRRDGIDVAVLNAGMAGLAPSDYVYEAPRHLREFQPAWTVVVLSDHDLEGDSWDVAKVHFAVDSGGRIELRQPSTSKDPNASSARRIYEALTDHIALVRFVRLRLHDFAAGVADEPPLFRGGQTRAPKPARPAAPPARVMFEIAQLKEAYAGRLTILLVCTFDPQRPTTPSLTETRLLDAASALGVRVVTTRGGYSEVAAEGRAPFGFANSAFNAGHMNALGHEVTSRALSSELRDLVGHGLL